MLDTMVEHWAHKGAEELHDLTFCNYHEDGTSTSKEPYQAFETSELGHSQLCDSHGISS